MSNVFETYLQHVEERAADGLPPLPLNVEQITAVCEALTNGDSVAGIDLIDLLTNRVSPGVDPAAKVKAEFLQKVAEGSVTVSDLTVGRSIELLGTMVGGFNVPVLVDLLSNEAITSGDDAGTLVTALSNSIIIDPDQFDRVGELLRADNETAQRVMQSWADADWFTNRPALPDEIEVIVFKLSGKCNTDNLSPGPDAPTRSDIPLHAKGMLRMRAPDALAEITELRGDDSIVALCGDDLWGGSSRKSAWNSVAWNMGEGIPYIPNKGSRAIVIGGAIAPIGRDTIRDSGGLAIICDVTRIESGSTIKIRPGDGQIQDSDNTTLAEFDMPDYWRDEWRAGGRLNLVTGRKLTTKAREALTLPASTVFVVREAPADTGKGFTLGQKQLGRACGLAGVRTGQYVEPKMSTVASQDTTGKMTRDEIAEQACVQFGADLVLQSFCHTAATPKATDLEMHQTLPVFMTERGGVSLRPGDGVIHTWINRMLLPDEVGTGGDSHTRFPLGISFPAGSGLVAYAAANGFMPLDVPKTVLVKFEGELHPGITIRDLVHAIPWVCLQDGRLTLDEEGKKNVFDGSIMEIDVRNLKMSNGRGITIEQSFEFADASAERSSAACCMINDPDEVIRYMRSNIVLLGNLLRLGYGDPDTIQRRIAKMEAWLEQPGLMLPDDDCQYEDVVVVNMSEITEPLLACPNDPDDVKKLSEVAGTEIDETFSGSCMTHRGHFQSLARVLDHFGRSETTLWVAPPSSMDQASLQQDGSSAIFTNVGANQEVPGCSLCMGNQKRTAPDATVVSTSTRNFDDRMGDRAQVFLASSEVTAVTSALGRIPTVEEYNEAMAAIEHSPVHVPLQFDVDGVPELVES